MSYYCVRKPRDADNTGCIPCPDTDKCNLCGRMNPDMQAVTVVLQRGEAKMVVHVLKKHLDEEQDILDRVIDYAKTYGEHQVPAGYVDPRDGFRLGDIVADKSIGHMPESQFAVREEYVKTLRRVIDRFGKI